MASCFNSKVCFEEELLKERNILNLLLEFLALGECKYYKYFLLC